jgi:hypothetical protein
MSLMSPETMSLIRVSGRPDSAGSRVATIEQPGVLAVDSELGSEGQNE